MSVEGPICDKSHPSPCGQVPSRVSIGWVSVKRTPDRMGVLAERSFRVSPMGWTPLFMTASSVPEWLCDQAT
jgi:hypothetical protein